MIEKFREVQEILKNKYVINRMKYYNTTSLTQTKRILLESKLCKRIIDDIDKYLEEFGDE